MRLSSFIKFGIVNDAWYVPIRPVSESRARNLITYFPGSSVKPGVVLNRPLCQLAAVSPLSLMSTLSRSSVIVDAVVVLHDADEIDQRLLCAAGAREGQFAAGNLDGDRDEVFGAVQLEEIDLHRDREVRDGIAQHQRFFELSFLIRRREFIEVFGSK